MEDAAKIAKAFTSGKRDPHSAESLAMMAGLNPSDFERLMVALKKEGFGATTRLRKYVDDARRQIAAEDAGPKQPAPADALVELLDGVTLFTESDGTAYAVDELQDEASPVYRIGSKAFRLWLTDSYLKKHGRAPGKLSLADAINTIEAKAAKGEKYPVHLRIAGDDNNIFIDLGDDTWEVIHVTAKGWTIKARPPGLQFKRTSSMRPLPRPVVNKDSRDVLNSELREFLNVSTAHYVLQLSWTLNCYRYGRPYAILATSGEFGAAKTSSGETNRSLIDPCVPLLSSMPKNEENLYVNADASHVIAYDNVSRISDEFSDALCRIATGGGYRTRMFYENREEVTFSSLRPIMLNGINQAMTRPDLIDRTVFIELQPIPDNKRKTKKALDTAWSEARPRVLGAILDMLAHGLSRLPTIEEDEAPRMADFDRFSRACETFLWEEGTFRTAYMDNRQQAKEMNLANDPVAQAVTEFMDDKDEWTGTAKELLSLLVVPDVGAMHWPGAPHILSRWLQRVAPNMREVRGLDIRAGDEGLRAKVRGQGRPMVIRRIEAFDFG